MEDNSDTSSSKKDGMQLDPEYFVKDKIKTEPMMDFTSTKYFDGAVKSEVQDIFESSSLSGSSSEELEEIEFVNMKIKLEVPEPSNESVLPSTKEENEMNLNSTKSEVDIFEPSSHSGLLFIKEEHEEVNIQNTASSQKSEEQILGQNSSEYDDTKKQLMGYKCNEKDCYKQALKLGLCTAHGGGSKRGAV